MRKRASREHAIAILEELAFNATYWDSKTNGPALTHIATEEIWATAVLIEKLYQAMEVKFQPPYFTEATGIERSSTGLLFEQILKKRAIAPPKNATHQLHGFLKAFYDTFDELSSTHLESPIMRQYKSFLPLIPKTPHRLKYTFALPTQVKPEQSMAFVSSVNVLYQKLYNRTLQKNAPSHEREAIEADLEFGKLYRKNQTQLTSRTGRTCKEAIQYFDQLLQQHQKLIVVSLTLHRSSFKHEEQMSHQWLINEWKKFLQNGRSSRPMTWNLGFLAGIRATAAKGLYIHAYFLFDAQNADPKDLEHAVGNYWRQTTTLVSFNRLAMPRFQTHQSLILLSKLLIWLVVLLGHGLVLWRFMNRLPSVWFIFLKTQPTTSDQMIHLRSLKPFNV